MVEEEREEEEWKGDVEELKEVLSVLSKEVPSLVRGLIDPLRELLDMVYDPEKTRERARAIASFYRELKDQGMPDSLIVEIMKGHFVNPLSLLKGAITGREREEGEEE